MNVTNRNNSKDIELEKQISNECGVEHSAVYFKLSFMIVGNIRYADSEWRN